MGRWLGVIKEEARRGFHPSLPQYDIFSSGGISVHTSMHMSTLMSTHMSAHMSTLMSIHMCDLGELFKRGACDKFAFEYPDCGWHMSRHNYTHV